MKTLHAVLSDVLVFVGRLFHNCLSAVSLHELFNEISFASDLLRRARAVSKSRGANLTGVCRQAYMF